MGQQLNDVSKVIQKVCIRMKKILLGVYINIFFSLAMTAVKFIVISLGSALHC